MTTPISSSSLTSSASTPTSSIAGVISGVQYTDLVNAIIAADEAPANAMRQQASDLQAQQTALATYKGLLQTLQDAAQSLQDGTAFQTMSATPTVTAGATAIASATASAFAAAGSYQIQVSALAQQQKIGSSAQTSSSASLGLAGTFTLNGQTVTIVSTDTLSNIADKINAADSGAAPSGVSATVIAAGTSQARLVLTSDQSGSAGMTLADTSGTVLQTLGILSAPTTISATAILQQGQDAQYSVDGISLTSNSNSITNAIQGVTLNLTQAAPGSITTITVARSESDAEAAVQSFVDAYNGVVQFIQQQNTAPASSTSSSSTTTPASPPPLYNDSLTRLLRAALPTVLLTPVAGAAANLSTAGLAGLSLDQTGKLSLNSTAFSSAFTTQFTNLATLFEQGGSASSPSTTYVASGQSTPAGTYAVNITQVATQAQVTGSGLGGTYADDGTADTMTITDTALGKSASISLTNGMTSTAIASALNSAFTTNGLGLVATDVGGEIRITQNEYGSAPGFTVAYTAGGTLGNVPIAAGTYANGLDVAGTINGEAATGTGQVLTANSGTTAQGLSVSYNGSATGDAGTVTVSLGVGSVLQRMLSTYTQANTGAIDTRNSAISDRIASLTARANALDEQLAVRKQMLLTEYANMEVTLGKLQAQSQSLAASVGLLTAAATNNTSSGSNSNSPVG
ncbi:MAG TPA: flagellar filament capping protein FliD [Gemmatimonadales bacterium]|nr:flagellar filament capping protein FliD [Gemmatimonadales bacterium]